MGTMRPDKIGYIRDLLSPTNGAGKILGPLELIHEPKALPIKVDGHKIAIRVKHWAPGVTANL